MMTSFDEFDERVFEIITEILGDRQRATEVCIRAEAAGVFNAAYDDAAHWTEENAQRVARFIVGQSSRDAAVLREFRRDLFGFDER